jgi:ABC-2 type transport system ATP-binding protein
VARVLLHDPQVLFLDEPASGLDPRARIEMRELLKELRRMGKTIIISSHILPELAELCTTVGIIERGELLFHGTIDEIVRKTKVARRIEVRVAARQEEAAGVLSRLEPVSHVESDDGRLLVSLKTEMQDYSFLARAILDAKLPLCEIKEEQVNLETAFMRLTKGIVQ